jgi:hypothetical protein
MNSLGGTLQSIASHKAGIFKPHRAALVGPDCPLHVMQVSTHSRVPVMITWHVLEALGSYAHSYINIPAQCVVLLVHEMLTSYIPPSDVLFAHFRFILSVSMQ